MEKKAPDRKWAKIDDFRVAYRQWGETGNAVVLLHGIPMNSILWHQIGPYLADNGFRVYAPEMLGLGWTEGPLDWDHSLRGQANLFTRFIQEVVNDECILVGHDLGGGSAQIMAAELSVPMKRLVLTNCVAFDSWPVTAVKMLIRMAKQKNGASAFTPEFVSGFLRRGLQSGLSDPSAFTEEMQSDIALGLAGDEVRTAHFIQFLCAMDNKFTRDLGPGLGAFDRKTILVWAKDDLFQPVSVGERLKAVMPGAAWHLIEGSHFHPMESMALAQAIIK